MAQKRDIDGEVCRTLRQQGWSLRLIACELGVSQSTVRYHTQGVFVPAGLKAQKVASQRYAGRCEPLPPSAELAYLVGVICGDGSIWQGPRTCKLSIACDARYPELIESYSQLLRRLTAKKVFVVARNGGTYFEVSVYGKHLPTLLNLPTGAKQDDYPVPEWIFSGLSFLRPFLRGLIETDGNVYHEFRNDGWASRCRFTNINPAIMGAFLRGTILLGYSFRHKGKDALLTRTALVKQLVRELDLTKQRVYIQKGSNPPYAPASEAT